VAPCSPGMSRRSPARAAQDHPVHRASGFCPPQARRSAVTKPTTTVQPITTDPAHQPDAARAKTSAVPPSSPWRSDRRGLSGCLCAPAAAARGATFVHEGAPLARAGRSCLHDHGASPDQHDQPEPRRLNVLPAAARLRSPARHCAREGLGGSAIQRSAASGSTPAPGRRHNG